MTTNSTDSPCKCPLLLQNLNFLTFYSILFLPSVLILVRLLLGLVSPILGSVPVSVNSVMTTSVAIRYLESIWQDYWSVYVNPAASLKNSLVDISWRRLSSWIWVWSTLLQAYVFLLMSMINQFYKPQIPINIPECLSTWWFTQRSLVNTKCL